MLNIEHCTLHIAHTLHNASCMLHISHFTMHMALCTLHTQNMKFIAGWTDAC